ncbi:hypothetical protein ACR782_01630 [Sphingobacterium spiritivorum]|uniref:hypothetical protein n=1 Tax=Sphingobacterium spiritivorum TaxID=258 RepID=UPI003DA493AC
MISKQLLEKYHLGLCSEEEQELVEQWLENDDLEIEGDIKPVADTERVKVEMWSNIRQDIKQKKNLRIFHPGIWAAVAAILIAIIGVRAIFINNQPSLANRFIFDNLSGDQIRNYEEHNYNITLSKKSFARINTETGELDVKGDIMFMPKKDIILNVCDRNHRIKLKSGETYILLDQNKSCQHIVLTKQELTFLSPILQNQLKIQFNIS